MYTIWFKRLYGPCRVDMGNIDEACDVWDALSLTFDMMSVRPRSLDANPFIEPSRYTEAQLHDMAMAVVTKRRRVTKAQVAAVRAMLAKDDAGCN